MKNHSVLLALHELEGIGWKTIRLLVNRFPFLPDLLGASGEGLQAAGLPAAKAESLLQRLTESHIHATEAKYEAGEIVPVTVGHPAYPKLLLETSQPPWVLYTRGNLPLLDRDSIAIVGTRTPTVYGKRMAETLSGDLSRSGVCVVSGLARGIDGAAHLGALRGPGSTIAVLGCGIDVVYPREHAVLYREISETGLIVSEYPPGMPGAPGMFPQRNRIIAGLSLGTVVVEAALRSGSLITADQALEESRDVFAVPGPVTSPKSKGTNALIQQGAKLVTSADDLLAEYRHIMRWIPVPRQSAADNASQGEFLTPEENRVLELISEGPVSIDGLLERLETNFGLLHAILLSLQIKKRIEQLPGSVYALI